MESIKNAAEEEEEEEEEEGDEDYEGYHHHGEAYHDEEVDEEEDEEDELDEVVLGEEDLAAAEEAAIAAESAAVATHGGGGAGREGWGGDDEGRDSRLEGGSVDVEGGDHDGSGVGRSAEAVATSSAMGIGAGSTSTSTSRGGEAPPPPPSSQATEAAAAAEALGGGGTEEGGADAMDVEEDQVDRQAGLGDGGAKTAAGGTATSGSGSSRTGEGEGTAAAGGGGSGQPRVAGQEGRGQDGGVASTDASAAAAGTVSSSAAAATSAASSVAGAPAGSSTAAAANAPPDGAGAAAGAAGAAPPPLSSPPPAGVRFLGGRSASGRRSRRAAMVEASVPPVHAGRQAENLADTESMLLVEFAGETGHGTGPTLEFYSLVCRELLKRGLGMWRGDDAPPEPPSPADSTGPPLSRGEGAGDVGASGELGSEQRQQAEQGDGEEAEFAEVVEAVRANSAASTAASSAAAASEVTAASAGAGAGASSSPPSSAAAAGGARAAAAAGGSEVSGSASPGREAPAAGSAAGSASSAQPAAGGGGGGGGGGSAGENEGEGDHQPYLDLGPEGLFPAPLDRRDGVMRATVETRFRLLGRLMGKALKDGRMLDLPLALPLCGLIVGLRRRPTAGAKPLALSDVSLIDEALGRSLGSVAELAREVEEAKAALGGEGSGGKAVVRSMSELEEYADNLCLSWTLPGYPWYELRPGGAELDVTAAELGQWVDEVTRVLLVDSVLVQVEALVKGVSEVMDPSTLSVLSAGELQRLISGEGAGSGADEEWEYGTIMASVVCRHGYTVDSSQVKWLARVMSDLDTEGRRQFLRFVTGTPRLPIGGFGALRPRLTVVKKEVDVPPGGTPDSHLPSCSTCQVYLKLPAYTSRAALEAKLKHAITEGQDHFALD